MPRETPRDLTVPSDRTVQIDGTLALSSIAKVTHPDAQDGDLFVWDANAGTFRPSGNLRIGALVEISGNTLPDADSRSLWPNPADTEHVTEIYRYGIGLTVGGVWVIVTPGRYSVSGYIEVARHATLPLAVHVAMSTPSAAGLRRRYLAAGSGFETIEVVATDDYPAGALVDIQVYVGGSGGETTLNDSYFSVQYVGPAVSLG